MDEDEKVCNIVFIKEKFFQDNKDFVEMLDPLDIGKQTQRNYVFLTINYKDNTFLVPLRTHMQPEKRFGIIGYAVPSSEKPNAGLDFRKMLIINNPEYIEIPEYCKIPKSQENIINENFSKINELAINYINGYVKAAIKNREHIEPKYCFSTLHNFHKELGIIKNIKEEIKTKIMNKPDTAVS